MTMCKNYSVNHCLVSFCVAAATAMAMVSATAVDYVTDATCTIEGSRLTVVSGNGTLASPTPDTITEICISNGASLKIGVDNPFAVPCDMIVFGTLDVNGRSFEALRFYNYLGEADILWDGYGRVVNTSSDAVTLTLTGDMTSGTTFLGTFEELPGKINIVSSNVRFWLRSPIVENHFSSLLLNRAGASLFTLDGPNNIRFVLYPPADATKPIYLGELCPTFGGMPVFVGSGSVTSYVSGNGAANLFDDKANTPWLAAEPGTQTVTFSTSRFVSIDGYRITPYDGTNSVPSNRPSGWDVYLCRGSDMAWTLVDSQRDFQWYSRQYTTSSTNILFSSAARYGSPFGTNTAITLNGSARISGNGTTTAGTLSGTGTVKIEDGSTFAPGDISSFTGVFTAASSSYADEMSILELSARGGKEQPVSIPDAANLAIVNGGTETVSVLLDDAREGERLFGKLSDGANGKLGLVKRGTGERVIETEDAAYTGPTAIHAGTLTVARKRTSGTSVTARYIRFTPLTMAESTSNDYGYPWSANEFKIFDENGAVVAWPTGTTASRAAKAGESSSALSAFIDGNTTTRMLMPKYTSGSELPPVVIDTQTGVTFASYSWWTPANANELKARVATSWRVEISDDGENWTVCDSKSAPVAASWSKTVTEARGPYSLNGDAKSSGSGLYTLPAEMFADGTSRDSHRKLRAQYFRFHVYETVNPEGSADSWGWQLAEIGLMKDGQRVDWPEETTGALSGSALASATTYVSLYNNVLSNQYGGVIIEGIPTPERAFMRSVPSFVTINAHQVLEFDAYSLTSTGPASSQNDRLPKTWKLKASLNGSDYYDIDSVSAYVPNANVRTKAYQELGPFPVAEKWPLLDMGAGDSLGDRSPVVIDENATLKLNTDYEKFGPLSGAGTLNLAFGAVGEINACAPATFSGKVTGEGTLAVCGTDVQTFDGATLSGAKTFELNGGAIAGTASFGGNNVTVAFNGGATGAALSGIGTLTVTGDVKYATPDVSGIESYSVTLFTATNIQSEVQRLLMRGEFVEASRKWNWGVTVTDKTVILHGNKRGTTIVIR